MHLVLNIVPGFYGGLSSHEMPSVKANSWREFLPSLTLLTVTKVMKSVRNFCCLLLTESVHELVVALLPVGSTVGHRVSVGRCLAERSGGVALAVAAAVIVAPRGAGRVRGAAAAAAAHLLDHLHLSSQLCRQQRAGRDYIKFSSYVHHLFKGPISYKLTNVFYQ